MGRSPDTTMTAEERLARMRAKNAERARKWRAANPDKVAQITHRYWQRRLERMGAEDEKQQPTGSD